MDIHALKRQGMTISEIARRTDHDRITIRAYLAGLPGAEELNDVVFTRVSVSFGDDERTQRVTQALLAGGFAWMSGSRWRGRDVLRISVSNWSTDADDVALSLVALGRAVAEADAVPAGGWGG